MILLTANSKILVACSPIDFRKGNDGFIAAVRQRLSEEPRSDNFFVFANRARTMARILRYEPSGFWLATKRLSSGRFPWWPDDPCYASQSLEARQLVVLLCGQNPLKSSIEVAW